MPDDSFEAAPSGAANLGGASQPGGPPRAGYEPDLDLAQRLLDGFAEDGTDGIGITRDSYGAGEQRAHDRAKRAALLLGLEVRTDAALNLYMTLPGRDRALPAAMTGSHLDSVPCGGNIDGAAGVAAGLAVLSGWRHASFVPPRDCTVMAIRAEESAWFPISYPGSKAAFGLLPADALELTREDTKQSLAKHMTALGGAPERLAAGEAFLKPTQIDRFIELHIEQGPHLIRHDAPVGIVTGIRGSFRFRHAAAIGTYAHSGAMPRVARKDAVVATARLLMALDEDWTHMEREGRDLVITFGKFATEPARADFSKVSGRVDFTIDIRSCEAETLRLMEERTREHAMQITEETGVQFELSLRTGSTPAPMDQGLCDSLTNAAARYGIKAVRMASGAGHDAAIFAGQGIVTAMIFVRNTNGSHNPDEAMSADDFACATRLLETALRS